MLLLLRRAVLTAVAILCLMSRSTADAADSVCSQTAAKPPNILLIFADDLGWRDVGYQGTDFYETPSIDRLAAEGMVFSNAYAAAGNCAPSRACLLSGLYTPRHGVYAVGRTDRGPRNQMRLLPIPNSTSLAADHVTVAEALRAAGYATGCFGKWHLGSQATGTSPTDQGFDEYFDSRHPDPNASRGRINEDPKGIFSLTAAAGNFMEQNRDRPFFCYVAQHAIHSALEARQATVKYFQAKAPGQQHDHVMYAACTADLDAGVGLLLGRLEELGLRDNTLVVFTSDNGGTPQSSQEPLRGNKGCYYEGGIREPFIVRWPGVTRPGSSSPVPVINVDLYPTFLAASGSTIAAPATLDGEDLTPLLAGTGELRRSAIYWHFPGYLDAPVTRGRDAVFRTRPVTVIRNGQWKLHLYHEEWLLDGGRAAIASNNAVELYDMHEDIGERTNIASTRPDVRDALLDDLLAWTASAGAPLPTEPNPAWDPDTADRQRRQQKP